jgi:hypothetical protein
MTTDEKWENAGLLLHGCVNDGELQPERTHREYMALALVLLTSPVKAEREAGKDMVRRWKKIGRV